MTSRQRGAAYLLGLLVLGRVLDGLDLPFEAKPEKATASAAVDSSSSADSSGNGAALAVRPTSAVGESTGSRTHPRAPRAGVDLNAAGAAELVALPGVGPVMAQRILEYRAAHGPFASLADLRRVKGIGPRTCERLAPLVRFD
jgi:competence protein ComEA